MTETIPALPDEDTFVIPTEWHRFIHPRRGGVGGRKLKLKADAADNVREYAETSDWVGRITTGSEFDPHLVEELTACLRGGASPVGAAALATVLFKEGRFRGDPKLFADAWAVWHGLAFAAAAAAELPRIQLVKNYARNELEEFRFRIDDDEQEDWFGDLLLRVRTLLATAKNDVYQDAVEALSECRHDEFQRMVACYLVPTRQDWVDELCADIAAAAGGPSSLDRELLLCSLGSVDQLGLLKPHTRAEWYMRSTVFTVAEGVGPSAAPVFADLFDSNEIDDYIGLAIRENVPTVLAGLPGDEAFELMLARLGEQEMNGPLLAAMNRFPVRALRLLARASSGTSDNASAAAELLRGHVLAHPELTAAVLPTLPAQARAAIGEIVAEQGLVEEAPLDALPRVLVDPPWARRKPARPAPVVIPDLTPPTDSRIDWKPGEQWRWTANIGTTNWGAGSWSERLEPLRTGDHSKGVYHEARLLTEGPEELVRPLVATWRPPGVRQHDVRDLKPVVVRFGLDALPAMLHIARSSPGPLGELLLPFFDRDVAVLMADWLARLKKARPVALGWFQRHGPATAAFLIPDALGKAGAARRGAEAALRFRASTGRRNAVIDAARGYGEQAAKAIEAMLADKPEEKPVKVPTIGDWAAAGRLPRILLREDGRALPRTAVENFVTMLAMSKPAAEYPGLDDVLRACEPRSLAEFGWAVFQRWQEVGEPAEGIWALTALCWLGDDDAAHALAPIIRAWPGRGSGKALAGVDVLAAIGTDIALTHLHGIAQKAADTAAMTRARDKVHEVAQRLGLTTDQLADRLVPDFGLDTEGRLTLDYGPRQFTVGFDEHLKPHVADRTGKRLKSLPKPGVRDDQELARAAYQRFTDLKTGVRTVAAERIRRFEQAMVAQHAWPVAEFRSLFVQHPLLWHIVRRLLWTSADGVAFRLAEDRSLADVHDNALTLPDTAQVRVAHPALLADTLDTWSAVFADYEILQPFPQLTRPVHTLTDDEKTSTDLKRFCDVTVPTGKVLGLTRRGWDRDYFKDNGLERWVCRVIPGGRAVTVDLDPGIYVGSPDSFPEQTITRVWLRDERDDLDFGGLDPVTASEIIADLTYLTS